MQNYSVNGLKHVTLITDMAWRQIQDILEFNWKRSQSSIYEITNIWRQRIESQLLYIINGLNSAGTQTFTMNDKLGTVKISTVITTDKCGIFIEDFNFNLPWGFPKGRYVLSPYSITSSATSSIKKRRKFINFPFFNRNGISVHSIGNENRKKYMLVNRKGEDMLTRFLSYLGEAHCGLCRIGSNSYTNFIDAHGNIIFGTWFARASDFDENTQTSIAWDKNGNKYKLFANGRMDLIEQTFNNKLKKTKKVIRLTESEFNQIIVEEIMKIIREIA